MKYINFVNSCVPCMWPGSNGWGRCTYCPGRSTGIVIWVDLLLSLIGIGSDICWDLACAYNPHLLCALAGQAACGGLARQLGRNENMRMKPGVSSWSCQCYFLNLMWKHFEVFPWLSLVPMETVFLSRCTSFVFIDDSAGFKFGRFLPHHELRKWGRRAMPLVECIGFSIFLVLSRTFRAMPR